MINMIIYFFPKIVTFKKVNFSTGKKRSRQRAFEGLDRGNKGVLNAEERRPVVCPTGVGSSSHKKNTISSHKKQQKWYAMVFLWFPRLAIFETCAYIL